MSQSLQQEGKTVWGQAGKDREGRPDRAAGKQEGGLLSGLESVSRDTSVLLQARALSSWSVGCPRGHAQFVQ